MNDKDLRKEKPFYLSENKAIFWGLGDEKFENMVIDLYKTQIEEGKHAQSFDDVIQTPKGKDRGQDGKLLYDDKQVGVIQCKCKKNPLEKKEAICEVLKFLLYTLEDDSLFSLGKKRRFTYVFASAMGFSSKDILATFPSLVENKDLVQYIKKTIKKNSSLKFDPSSPESLKRLKKRISQTKVILLGYEDLDAQLTTYRSVLEKYFRVALLTSDFDTDREQEKKSKVDKEKILSDFDAASFTLASFSNTFGNYHLQRQVVEDIVEWIKDRDSTSNFAVVSGKAGSGKTTIMRAVYEVCKKENIAILGVKADSQSASNESQLKENLNLSIPIVDSFRQLAQMGSAVLLVDQLDALSKNFTNNSSQMRTYISIVEKLKKEKQIKIIISVREYDAQSDEILLALNKESIKKFSINILSEEEVYNILTTCGIPSQALSKTLIETLKVPIYLSLYVRLQDSNTNNTDLLTPLSLYQSFYYHILKRMKNSKRVEKLLKNIVSDMFEQSLLSIPSQEYKIIDPEIFASLISSGILVESQGRVTFFHQTFFEYLYVRNFLKEGKSILHFIKKNKQSIRIRTLLSTYLELTRESFPKEYLNILREVLLGDEYMIHIKNLIYYTLGKRENLCKEEITIINELSKNHKLFIPFINSCRSKVCAKYILNHNLLDNLLDADNWKEAKRNFIAEHLEISLDDSLRYIQDNPLIFNQNNLLNILIWDKRNWNNDQLWEFTLSRIQKINFLDFLHIRLLGKILTSSRKISSTLLNRESILQQYDKHKSNWGYEVNEIFSKLLESQPEEYIPFLVSLLDEYIKTHKDEIRQFEGLYWEDTIFFDYIPHEDVNEGNDISTLMDKLVNQLRSHAENKSPLFENFYENFKDSNSYTWNLILAYILANIKSTEEEKSLYIFQRAYLSKELGCYEPLHKQYWYIIRNKFSLCSSSTQNQLLEIICSIHRRYEISTANNYSKKSGYKYFKYTTYIYLDAIPEDIRNKKPKIKRLYGELFRKHGKIEYNWKKMGVMGSFIGAPLSSSAYELMTDRQWVSSFLKFNEEYRSGSMKGGILEHSRAFESVCKSNPIRFLPFLKSIINDKRIWNLYKISGLNGIIEGNHFTEDTLSVFLQIMSLNISSNDEPLMTRMLIPLAKNYPNSSSLFEVVRRYAKSSFNTDYQDERTLRFAINSTQGKACNALIPFIKTPKFKEIVFNDLDYISKYGKPSTQLIILKNTALLIEENKKKALNLFLTCVNPIDEESIKSALFSIHYFNAWAFSELTPFYEEAIEKTKDKDLIRTLIIFLSHACFDGHYLANNLLEKALKNWGTQGHSTLIEVAFANISDISCKKQCQNWLEHYLETSDKDIQNAFSLSFLRCNRHKENTSEGLNINVLMPLLLKYVISPCFRISRNHIFDFLKKNVLNSPDYVLELISLMDFSFSEITFENLYDCEKWISVIINALEYASNEILIEKATVKLDQIFELIDNPSLSEETLERLIRNG